MDKQSLFGMVKVFPPDGAGTVLVDNIKIALWYKGQHIKCWWKPKLPNGVRLQPGPGGLATISWERDGMRVRQWVGKPVNWVPGKLTRTIDWNPLRLLRGGSGKPKYTWMPAENYLNPKNIPPDEAHSRVVSFIPDFCADEFWDYCVFLGLTFGKEINPTKIDLSINEIELTWDRSCRIARTAPAMYWNAWRTSLKSASFHAPCLLKAHPRKGESYKLYKKAPNVLRYEVQLSKGRLRSLVEAIDLRTPESVESGLSKLAAIYYPKILEIQDSLDLNEGIQLPEILTAGVSPSLRPKLLSVYSALLLDGCLQGPDYKERRVLSYLREKDIVDYGPEKGFWYLTKQARPIFETLRSFLVRFGPKDLSGVKS